MPLANEDITVFTCQPQGHWAFRTFSLITGMMSSSYMVDTTLIRLVYKYFLHSFVFSPSFLILGTEPRASTLSDIPFHLSIDHSWVRVAPRCSAAWAVLELAILLLQVSQSSGIIGGTTRLCAFLLSWWCLWSTNVFNFDSLLYLFFHLYAALLLLYHEETTVYLKVTKIYSYIFF